MKTFTKILFFTVFFASLSPPVLTQSQAQSVPSVNNWRYIPGDKVTDFSETKSFFFVDHNSQVFANYGWTTYPQYWNLQVTWAKDFSAFSTPDTIYLDCRFLSGINIEKIIAINVFIAIQNPNKWYFDGTRTQHNNIPLNSVWKTLYWDMSVAKEYGLNSFSKLYFAYQVATIESTYVGINVIANTSWGFYNDSKKIIVYDSFGDITDVPRGNSLPKEFILSQNYPNPFNPTTKIEFSVPTSSQVSLKVYDLLGREVSTLVNEYKIAGNYEVVFNASNLPSGMYIYRLQGEKITLSKKMILIK
jgi:hypothetical protein